MEIAVRVSCSLPLLPYYELSKLSFIQQYKDVHASNFVVVVVVSPSDRFSANRRDGGDASH